MPGAYLLRFSEEAISVYLCFFGKSCLHACVCHTHNMGSQLVDCFIIYIQQYIYIYIYIYFGGFDIMYYSIEAE